MNLKLTIAIEDDELEEGRKKVAIHRGKALSAIAARNIAPDDAQNIAKIVQIACNHAVSEVMYFLTCDLRVDCVLEGEEP